MKKVAVVYWSGTGNTEAMAMSVADGVRAKGAEVDLFTSGDFTADMVKDYDSIAFGCPSMGDEVLEEQVTPAHVRRVQRQTERQEDSTVRILWLGRRGMDAQLGS